MILEAQRQSHKQKQRGKKTPKDPSAKYHTSVVSLNRGGGKHGAVLRNEADRDLLGELW